MHGSGKVFTATFLRELRNAEQKAAPMRELDEGAEDMVWRDIGKIRRSSFKVSNLLGRRGHRVLGEHGAVVELHGCASGGIRRSKNTTSQSGCFFSKHP